MSEVEKIIKPMSTLFVLLNMLDEEAIPQVFNYAIMENHEIPEDVTNNTLWMLVIELLRPYTKSDNRTDIQFFEALHLFLCSRIRPAIVTADTNSSEIS